jgi:hypothetical protein
MTRFDAYLLEVQQRHGHQPMQLIRAWTVQETAAVEAAIRAAAHGSGLVGSVIPNFTGTNQAKGNRAADHFVAAVPPFLPHPFRIGRATGSGYPDRVFANGPVGYCMELKATSNWQNGDGNRRVLTSRPEKMRRLVNEGKIANPPAHFICTVLYSDATSQVTGIRLDFLEPDSPINIRLEASTSQSLLTQGTHQKAIIP